MREQQLAPVAGMMIDAYLATAEYRHTFATEHGLPPTLASRAHHMRSVMQARIRDDGRYALHAEYAELGRVQFTDREHDQVFVIRSESAVAIERRKAQREALFNSIEYLKSDVLMIVYEFALQDLSLSIAGTRRVADRKRLEQTGDATFVGLWAFTPTDTPAFDQNERDRFDDLEQDDEAETGEDYLA
jgi:hypothetical protein